MDRNSKLNNSITMRNISEISIRLVLLFLMLYWCYSIVMPFIEITIWSIIFAVALFPGYKWFMKVFGGRKTPSAIVVVTLMIIVFLLPAVFFATSLYDGVTYLKNHFETAEKIIPEAPASVLGWPLIGKLAYEKWNWISQNLSEAAQKNLPQIKEIGITIVSTIASAGVAYLKFFAAIIIAGFIMVYSESASKMALNVFVKLLGDKGDEFAEIAKKTIRTVVKGILGVAVIQSTLLGIGLAVAGIPGTGLWVMLSLIFGIVQIGVFPVVIPALIYAFATFDTFHAVALLIWCIIISPLDNILKPILLGRGAMVPMGVIFIGAIGGFIHSGIVGLFTGAIIFSIGYKLFLFWLEEQKHDEVLDIQNKQ